VAHVLYLIIIILICEVSATDFVIDIHEFVINAVAILCSGSED